ncbi:hypothetical protein NQZ68_029451 [Dissostichus eleginoides]|nr:hypothetical protein NQZ68_029451 [Dissostichus eleginoides]
MLIHTNTPSEVSRLTLHGADSADLVAHRLSSIKSIMPKASSDSGRAPGNSEVSMIEFDKFAVSWERGICFKYSRVEKAAADDWESSSSHRLLGGSGRLSYRNGQSQC